MDRIAQELTNFYVNTHEGKFLDIGATGNKKSFMNNVYDKFRHFAGPLKYWLLDIDDSIDEMKYGIRCNIEDCKKIANNSFDVTFSHTVMEHVRRPEKAFDTISRITKKNGLSIHVLPWTYHFHAVPFDMYRFSHQALSTIFQDRGFEIIYSGYDICEKTKQINNEYYPVIWLSFVIARKL